MDAAVERILADAFAGLVNLDAKGQIIRGAVEAWEMSGDGVPCGHSSTTVRR